MSNQGIFKRAIETLMGFIAALTIQNSIFQIASIWNIHQTPLFDQMLSLSWLSFFTSITLTIRFFIGNFQYFQSENINDDRFDVIVLSITILLQSVILAFASYFILKNGQFFIYVSILFIIDVIWFIITAVRASILNLADKLNPNIGYNQILSIITTLIILCLIINYNDFTIHHSYLLTIVIGLNFIVDLLINYKRYLGIK